MAKKRKAVNTEKFPHSNKLIPKQGYLVGASEYDPLRASGREMGHLANIARAKTAASLLDFSRYVYTAYSRFYEPWKKVGRKASKRLKEAKAAEAHWGDFLTELGWSDFIRYQKQIKQLADIGRRYEQFLPHSDVLPSSVSALSVLAKHTKDESQLRSVIAKCSPESTAAEVKDFLAIAPKVTQSSTNAVASVGVSLPIEENSRVANAFVIALMLALEMDQDESLGSDFSLDLLASVDADLVTLVKRIGERKELKKLVDLYDQMLIESGLAEKIEAERARAAQELRASVEHLYSRLGRDGTQKKRDYSKLKV